MLPLLLIYLSFTYTSPCLVVDAPCRCPSIKTISQAQIKSYPSSAYLGNRVTYNPIVTVDKSCKITVDCSKMTGNNFYFMIYRSDNPPIFNRRFLPSTSKTTKFSPTGISCVRVEDQFQWQYFGGKVTDMAFAMQAAECGCKALFYGIPVLSSGVNLYNTCDIYRFTCSRQGTTPFLVDDYTVVGYAKFDVEGRQTTLVVDDLTCVSKVWYFNNHIMPNPYISCVDPKSLFMMGLTTLTYPCNCRDIEIPNIPLAQLFFSSYDTKGIYYKYKYNPGVMDYDLKMCVATPSCPGSDTLAIFARNKAAQLYSLGDTPFITCQRTPLVSGSSSDYYWFVDGFMTSFPAYACIAGCACKYIKMTPDKVKRLVGTHSFYKFMAPYPMATPTDNSQPNTCPSTVSCASGLSLVVFDTQTVSTYSTGSISAVCTPTTRKWTVDKAADVPVLDQLYAICVDFRVSK